MGPKREWRSRAREGRARSRRDRSSSVPRSVQFRVEIGSTAARPGAGAARRAFRRESNGGVVGLAPKCRPRRGRGRAPAGSPTSAGPLAPHGPDQHRGVVPDAARSYPDPRGRTLKPPYSTTRRRTVRPRAFMYDRASPGTTGPRQRPPAPSDVRPHEQRHHRTTLPPHQTPPDPSPPHPDHGHPPRPQAAQHVRPPTTTGLVTNRLTAQPRQTNRSRAGTRPNSSRN